MDELLVSAAPHERLQELADQGILKQYFPELDALRGVEQSKRWHPEGDVFEHTRLMLSHMAWKTIPLGWSVLLHDIGKKAAQTFGDDGTPHFYGHERIGADMCPAILQRYGFDEETIDRITTAVRQHMAYTRLEQMNKKKQLKFLNAENFDLQLELHRLDCISSNGILGNYLLLLDLKRETALTPPPPPPLITGKDLLEMGLTPGPVFSELLRKISELQSAGKLQNRMEALDHIKKLLA